MLTPQQLKDRIHTIGSSEIAALVGLNPWSGPLKVWLTKGAQAATEQEGPANAELMALGHLMESVIGQLAEEKLGEGWQVTRATGTVTHRAYPWAAATPDFWVAREELSTGLPWPAILEAKNVGYRMVHAWTDGPPAYVDAQVQWQLEICDIDDAYIAALLGGRDLQLTHVVRDHEYGASIIRIAERFWHDHVLAAVPPPVDGSKDSSKYLAYRYPTNRDPLLVSSAETEALALDLKGARAATKAAKQAESELQNKLCDAIGDAAGLELADGSKITWKAAKGRRSVAWEKIARELGADSAQIEAHTSTGKPSRRFVVPKGW